MSAFFFAKRRDTYAWILLYLYVGSVASSILRNDPAALHPFRGGPRYFFFPFFLTSWILIQFALTADRKWLRNSAGIVAIVGALNAIPQWTRSHDDLHWAEHLVSARLFSEYDIPIESDGHWFRAWSIQEPGAAWERLLRKDRFLSPAELGARPTFAYRVVSASELEADGWAAADPPDGSQMISIGSSGAKKETLIRLSTSRRIRFSSGAAKDFPFIEVIGHEKEFIPRLPLTTDWVTLEFSNSRLPKEFTVRVVDRGQGVGQWAAVGAQ
jgi:hypothetical protein